MISEHSRTFSQICSALHLLNSSKNRKSLKHDSGFEREKSKDADAMLDFGRDPGAGFFLVKLPNY